MENSLTTVGSSGFIKRHEFVRVIIQSLSSLGYSRSASCLESESGISYMTDYRLLEEQVLEGNWDGCVETLNGMRELMEDTRASALFLMFKQCLVEFLNCGDDSSALALLRKQVSSLRMGKERVHNLAHVLLFLTGMETGMADDNFIHRLRKKLLTDLEKLLPPPIVIPEGRLEHLVETVITSQIESCLYHNTQEAVSIFEDHCCPSDQIPTETVQILSEHESEVLFVQFSNNGEYLASSSSDCTAIIWKVLQDDMLTHKHTLRSHQKPVFFVAWSPDDTMLLTCGNGEVLKLWDVETGTCKHTFGDHGFMISSCAWFPDSKRLVCGSSDPEKGICMWDCEGNEIKAWRGMRMPKVLDLAVTPDGEHLISILSDKEIRILNMGTTAERIITEEHSITSLSISSDNKHFIVNLNSQEIHLWDVTKKWLKPLKYMGHKQHEYVIRSCFGGLNSSFIASGSEDSQVYVWNWRNSKPVKVLSGHSRTVNCVTWNPARHQILASASHDHTIRIWSARQSKNSWHGGGSEQNEEN